MNNTITFKITIFDKLLKFLIYNYRSNLNARYILLNIKIKKVIDLQNIENLKYIKGNNE